MADQIAFTRSCAESILRQRSIRTVAAVDQRFAMLAAGLAAHDPAEAYLLDLMASPRERVQDKDGHYRMCAVRLRMRQ